MNFKYIIFTLAFSFASMTHASVSGDSTKIKKISSKILEQLDEKLDLSDAQETAILPLLYEKVGRVKAIRKEYAGKENANSKRDKMTEARNVFTSKLRDILAPDQFKDYKKFVKEVRSNYKKNKKSEYYEDGTYKTKDSNVL